MSNESIEIDNNSDSFIRGMNDGYNAFNRDESGDDNYNAGFTVGNDQWFEDNNPFAGPHEDEHYDALADFYDYDPSPYSGTYSEM